jgi:hypothetical protein
VAVDGAYQLFPGARPRSANEQAEAIIETAAALGIGCTVHRPKNVWYGNEVEKRQFLVDLGSLIAEPSVDWFLRIDGDEVVTDVPPDIHARLGATDYDVGGVTLWWRDDLHASEARQRGALRVGEPQEGSSSGLRFLLRALPEMQVGPAHYIYTALKGDRRVCLYGREDLMEVEPYEDFSDLRIEHRHAYRAQDRMERAAQYHRLRDEYGIERVVETVMEGI